MVREAENRLCTIAALQGVLYAWAEVNPILNFQFVYSNIHDSSFMIPSFTLIRTE